MNKEKKAQPWAVTCSPSSRGAAAARRVLYHHSVGAHATAKRTHLNPPGPLPRLWAQHPDLPQQNVALQMHLQGRHPATAVAGGETGASETTGLFLPASTALVGAHPRSSGFVGPRGCPSSALPTNTASGVGEDGTETGRDWNPKIARYSCCSPSLSSPAALESRRRRPRRGQFFSDQRRGQTGKEMNR
jgi:hypothetical protein